MPVNMTVPKFAVITLATESTRQVLISPAEDRLYLVKETGNLWSYNRANQWWKLLNNGKVQKRTITIPTISLAIGYSVGIESGSLSVWSDHGTIYRVPELCYITNDAWAQFSITQLRQNGETTANSFIPAINKYHQQDNEHENDNKGWLELLARGKSTSEEWIDSLAYNEGNYGLKKLQLVTIWANTIKRSPIYFYYFVIFTCSNSVRVLGVNKNVPINTPPLLGFSTHNIHDANNTLTPETVPKVLMPEGINDSK